MIYRAIRIYSTYEALEDKFDIIRRQLNLVYIPRATTPTAPKTDTVVLRVPFYAKSSQVYATRITVAVNKQYPLKKIRAVYDMGVVYEATYPQCNEKYIGKTRRHLKTRMNEDLSDQNKILSTSTKASELKLNSNSSSEKLVDNHNLHMMMARSKSC
ncbi:unnamed protein product [Adineta steineri]|uniref:Uncharacterized protein n=1 Tax=Adineta steineri TaxID=433720 RepID=A0A813UFS2_9BILA|nr:unnamed protein product [Adineta steineri]